MFSLELIGRLRAPLRPLPFRARSWVPAALVLSDLVGAAISLALAWLCFSALFMAHDPAQAAQTVMRLAIALGTIPVAFALWGLCPGYGLGPVERLRLQTTGICVVFAALGLWEGMAGEGPIYAVLLILAFVAALVVLPLLRSGIIFGLSKMGLWGRPVAVAGRLETVSDLIHRLHNHRELGLIPAAVLSHGYQDQVRNIEGVPVTGTLEDADGIENIVESIIITQSGRENDEYFDLIERLPFEKVFLVPSYFGLQSTWITPRDFSGVLALELKRNLLVRHNQIMKRALDIVIATTVMIFLAPLFIPIALLIKATSRGPIFFSQAREGLDGRTIHVLKLRSMYEDAAERLKDVLRDDPEARAEWNRYFKLRKDPRIVPIVGTFLRRSSLDEVPQVWNVLRGDMSIVGPRPFPTYHLEGFPSEFRQLRRKLRPGITGLWQVEERSDGDLEKQQALDTYYIRNWSMWLDIYILVRTLATVSRGQGAR